MIPLSNVLAEETSPYLLQHKDNPVNWQTWCPQVLEAAAIADKPIFLSIGYSTNHWCKVMAVETFCHPQVVADLNEHFVCIKVDREERPDLDDIYQTGHQLLCGQAGAWPLSVFLCPHSHLPFVEGTYYPPESNSVQLGFIDLIDRVLNFYHGDRAQFETMIEQVRLGFQQLDAPLAVADEMRSLHLAPLKQSVKNLLNTADRQYGGFGHAPKFALPFQLQRLLIASRESTALATRAKQHLHLTLMMMSRGGIRDLVGGGFFRYSTDSQWSIPHFEKMLYDNACLLAIYAEASKAIKSSLFAKTARGIAQWVCSEMSNGEGAFYSSLDSDNAFGEGAYYCWQTEELRTLLTEREYEVMSILCRWQGMPNFYGLWHIQVVGRVSDVVEELGLSAQEVNAAYRSGIAKLTTQRRHRLRPARDDKILSSSNALVVRGLAIAGRILEDPLMVSAALRCIDFLSYHLWHQGRLYATWRDGQVKVLGFLDDYAFMMDALLECLESQWRDQDFKLLVEIADTTLELFDDPEAGGLFFTSSEHEQLIHRAKPLYDRVTPSGNGVAAKALARLGHLASEEKYTQAARRIVEALWPSVEAQPELHDSLLQAVEELHHPIQVMVTGQEAAQWRTKLVDRFVNRVHCYAVLDEPDDQDEEFLETRALLCVGVEQSEYDDISVLFSAIDVALVAQPVTTGDLAQ
ncbi:thioredoxin domain-containing protein [Halioxenophilus sp. WMMB6]|uniref:thioredoxin domain-containing protein n=1 Tax=Halioxenophilus sp. WMMB6 TaxID=3073815 RepID=UPI00295EB841|nr:thioredoxin domain-containing protein [Halioxenophilus sp. WMMB6]